MDEDIQRAYQLKIDRNQAEIDAIEAELSDETGEAENLELGQKIADSKFSTKNELETRNRLRKIGVVKT